MVHSAGRVAAACTALCLALCAGAVVSVVAFTKRATSNAVTGAQRVVDASALEGHTGLPFSSTVVLLLGCLAAVACAT